MVHCYPALAASVVSALVCCSSGSSARYIFDDERGLDSVAGKGMGGHLTRTRATGSGGRETMATAEGEYSGGREMKGRPRCRDLSTCAKGSRVNGAHVCRLATKETQDKPPVSAVEREGARLYSQCAPPLKPQEHAFGGMSPTHARGTSHPLGACAGPSTRAQCVPQARCSAKSNKRPPGWAIAHGERSQPRSTKGRATSPDLVNPDSGGDELSTPLNPVQRPKNA